MKDEQRTPLQIAIFFLSLMLVIGIGSYLNPSPEISINENFTLRTPQWKLEVLEPIEEEPLVIFEDRARDTIVQETPKSQIKKGLKTPSRGLSRISFSNYDTLRFKSFSKSLKGLNLKTSLRILHYGDSQIEGDRMTREIRDFFQKNYGGSGAGFQNLTPFVPMAAVAHNTKGEWHRMVSFGRKNQKQPQGRYGLSGISNRYEVRKDDGADATVSFKPRKYGYSRARKFSRFELFHGPSKGPLEIKWFANDTLWRIEYLDSTARGGSFIQIATDPVKELRLEFKGNSPDLYGISLDGFFGVNVDNISMRGASGTSFTQMDEFHFSQEIRNHSIGLIILQFGGNSVPYFKSKESVNRYGDSFVRQIRLFRRLVPSANILVIGPSDMAFKDGLNWVSYPFVREVRDIMKKVAFDEKVGFFDLFAFMGEEGSMIDWVNQSPPLAGPDYIHFTPRGAKKVGKAIVSALEFELSAYE